MATLITLHHRGHDCPTHINQFMFVPLIVLHAMTDYVRYTLDTDAANAWNVLFTSTENEIRRIYNEGGKSRRRFGWRRAIGASCPSPNPRNEVHYDEDFHSSGMTIPPSRISLSGLPVSPYRREVSSALSRATVLPSPSPRPRRIHCPAQIVVRERPVARATRLTPPRPKDSASQAAYCRRSRSVMSGCSNWYFDRTASIMVVSLIQ